MRKLLILLALLSGYAAGQSTASVGLGVCPSPTACGPFAQSLNISPQLPLVPLGSSLQMNAEMVLDDGSDGGEFTDQCGSGWQSTNSGVVSVTKAGVITAVSIGTATISCTLPTNSGITGSDLVSVVGAPRITQPTCASPPCALPGGTAGVAYSFTFAAIGGTPPYTWSVSASNFNACFSIGNSALASTGILSATGGNVTAGTCTPTVQVTDSVANSTTLQVTLTIAGSGCSGGPPNYNCTLTAVQQGGAFTPTAFPFTGVSSACSPGPYPACSGVDNTIVTDPEPSGGGNASGLYHNRILRVTNGASGCGNLTQPACPGPKQNINFSADQSGGDEGHWSTDSTRFWLIDGGSTNLYYSFDPGTMQATFLYSTYGSSNADPTGTMKQTQGATFSPTIPKLVYAMSNLVGNGNGFYLNKWDVTSTSVAPSPSLVYNFNSSVNGIPVGANSSTDPPNIGVIAGVDTVFVDGFSTSSSQDTARYVGAYKVGPGISVWHADNNMISGDWGTTSGPLVCQNCILTTAVSSITGASLGGGITQYIATVTSSAGFNVGDSITLAGATTFNGTFVVGGTATGQVEWLQVGGATGTATGGTITDNTPSPGTFKIHNVKLSYGGVYAFVYVAACDPSPNVCFNKTSPYQWQIGTNKVWTQCPAASGNLCSGHSAPAALAFYTNTNFPFFGSHPFATPGTPTGFPTTFCTTTLGNDMHFSAKSMIDSLDDTPLIGSTGNANAADYTKCVSNEVFGAYGPSSGQSGTWKRFGHTYVVPTKCFGAEYALGAPSQDGKWFLFATNMNAQLGCMDGTAGSCSATVACNVGNNSARSDVFIMELK